MGVCLIRSPMSMLSNSTDDNRTFVHGRGFAEHQKLLAF